MQFFHVTCFEISQIQYMNIFKIIKQYIQYHMVVYETCGVTTTGWQDGFSLYIYRNKTNFIYHQWQLPPLAFCMLYVVSVETESMYVQYVVYNNDQVVYILIFRQYVPCFEYALFYVQICTYFTNITKTMGSYAIFSCNLL